MLRLKLPHHTDEGYCNLYPSAQSDAQTGGTHDDVAGDTLGLNGWEPVRPDVEFLRRNRERPTLTWLGHSTFLLQIGGINVLTDPHFGEHASALPFIGPKRLTPPALRTSQLPRIDAVVLSHDHYDHFDRRTLKRLLMQGGGAPNFYVPLGLKARLGDAAYAFCTELDWWQWAQMSGVVMHCVPAHHDSGRVPWDQDRTLWCGWVVEHAGLRFYFAGDTGYSPALLDIGRRFPAMDLAALPIAGHASRWRQAGMSLSPAQAVRLHRELGVRQSVAMHWGTFVTNDEPLDAPIRQLASATAASGVSPAAFFGMRVGETVSLQTATGLVGPGMPSASGHGPSDSEHAPRQLARARG